MAQILSFISSKGGVGKSTTTINLSAALADMGLKVLVVDLDPQQSLTKFFQYPERPKGGLLEFIMNLDASVVSKTHIENLDIIVNNDRSEELNKWMDDTFGGNFALKKALQKLRSAYDIIIVDTQGKDGRGQLQEMALIASEMVITPTTPDVISSQELPRTIGIYNSVVNGLSDIGLTDSTPTLKLLINRQDHTTETKTITAEIREEFSDIARHISVLKTVIPSRVVYRNCVSKQVPAHRTENKRTVSDREAICVMEALIHEIFPHYEDLTIGDK